MKKVIIFSLIVLILAAFVSADMIPTGSKYITYCFTIENQADYPNYLFFLYAYPLAEGVIISSGSCISFYKFASPNIYAIKKTSLENQELSTKLEQIHEQIKNEELNGTMERKAQEFVSKIKSGALSPSPEEIQKMYPHIKTLEEFRQEDYYTIREYALLEIRKNEFFKHFEGHLTKSELQLSIYPLVSEYDPLKSAEDVLGIILLDGQNFIVNKEKIIYTYEDGTKEEKLYADQNHFPEPSKTTILPWWTNTVLVLGGVLLSLTALVIIIILIVKRIRK